MGQGRFCKREFPYRQVSCKKEMSPTSAKNKTLCMTYLGIKKAITRLKMPFMNYCAVYLAKRHVLVKSIFLYKIIQWIQVWKYRNVQKIEI